MKILSIINVDLSAADRKGHNFSFQILNMNPIYGMVFQKKYLSWVKNTHFGWFCGLSAVNGINKLFNCLEVI